MREMSQICPPFLYLFEFYFNDYVSLMKSRPNKIAKNSIIHLNEV